MKRASTRCVIGAGVAMAAAVLGVTSFAWACSGQGEITAPTNGVGTAGESVVVAGRVGPTETVDLLWKNQSNQTQVLASQVSTRADHTFSTNVTVPAVGPGLYLIQAVGKDGKAEYTAVTTFEVVAAETDGTTTAPAAPTTAPPAPAETRPGMPPQQVSQAPTPAESSPAPSSTGAAAAVPIPAGSASLPAAVPLAASATARPGGDARSIAGRAASPALAPLTTPGAPGGATAAVGASTADVVSPLSAFGDLWPGLDSPARRAASLDGARPGGPQPEAGTLGVELVMAGFGLAVPVGAVMAARRRRELRAGAGG